MTEARTRQPAPGEAAAAGSADGGEVQCWCCGWWCPDERLVRLEDHREVGVCLRCAHFLHRQARQREDALRPSMAGRVRDGLRRGRQVVMDRGWHQRPVIGGPLRWLGRHLP
jgi:hypothetical protein